MSVSTKHPEYSAARIEDWTLARSAYEGESIIKAAGEVFLPKPSGYCTAAGYPDNGAAAYADYKRRAQFPDIMQVSIGAMVGIIHQREIIIEMPGAMGYLNEDANNRGMTLSDFHKRITRELLVMGRYGVLADAPRAADGGNGGGQPFLAGYTGPAIINWDEDDGNLFVLDESGMERDGFVWKHVEEYRVLKLDGGRYVQEWYRGGNAPEDITPTGLGGNALNRIPFVAASAKDIGPDIETPPLIGVARAARAMYQLSADYRLQLYMSGQETLVAINGEAPQAVGAGVVHEMHGTEQQTPDLKYVSPSCSGIDAHLEAIEHNREAAVQSGARLFEQSKQSQESGEARSMRFKSETSNLLSIAQVSCSLLERSLRNVAVMLGLNEEEVTVKAPTDLLDPTLDATEITALWSLVTQGGMSWPTFYERMQKGGIMSPERDEDEEYQLIQSKPVEVDDLGV